MLTSAFAAVGAGRGAGGGRLPPAMGKAGSGGGAVAATEVSRTEARSSKGRVHTDSRRRCAREDGGELPASAVAAKGGRSGRRFILECRRFASVVRWKCPPSSNFPPTRRHPPRVHALRAWWWMRRSACVLPDTCRPRADPTTARMRRVALEQLRTSGAAELRASWQLDSFFDRTFVVSMRSRCLCPPVRPTASTYASQGWVACLPGRTDRRHHMQRVLAQHGTRKVRA